MNENTQAEHYILDTNSFIRHGAVRLLQGMGSIKIVPNVNTKFQFEVIINE